ncbi:hypothetical protein O181_109263 [Austropuccinia psidii MF-1]|uniref:Uncharacterized protein n=1 Tax=Austropuccinia psidii MF-1 TaxID=1389203 RepID=A0A9Q3JVR5_9BASI|nr:hypothetical protein [Austropuccinia psidii MF-1]
MENDTPESQLSTYDHQQRLFQGEKETEEVSNSPTFTSAHPNEFITFIMGSQIQTGQNAEETPSQALVKRHNRHTHEETQLHRQQVEHEQTLK